ncbi:MAG: hypothetical protein ABJG68_06420 [Crocinitomicaceae bacterium]
MKKYLLILFIAIGNIASAQAPNLFKYQAVARNTAGEVLANQSVGFEISILQNSSGGTSVYTETHAVTTNLHGLANLSIGGGAVVSGDFSTIDWGNAIYFLQVKMDATGGTAYVLMGSSQLLSVPYALNAKTVSEVDWTDVTNVPADLLDGDSDVLGNLACSTDQIAVYNGTNWVCQDIPNSTAGQDAGDAYGTAQLTLLATTTTYTLIPGLTQTITVPANAKVYVSTNGGVQAVGTGTNYAVADIAIYVDGGLVGPGGQQEVVAANTSGLGNMLTHWSFSKSYSLSAGTHTISVMAKDGGGTLDANVSGTNGLIQGVLSVLIINQ